MDIFLIFAQNIDCGYTLAPHRRDGSNEYPQSEAVLTCTHNLCFEQKKIRKFGIPLQTPFFLYKNEIQESILFIDMFS